MTTGPSGTLRRRTVWVAGVDVTLILWMLRVRRAVVFPSGWILLVGS
jgi:hypothetical protein